MCFITLRPAAHECGRAGQWSWVGGKRVPGGRIEEPAGAATFAAAVSHGLAKRFQAGISKPGVLFLDRGRAFINTVTGRVTAELAAVLEPTELELFWGADAHEQPGYCADVLLHETAVAWIRKGLSASVPRLPWKETRAQYSMRLRDVVAAINRRHNVERGAVQRIARPPGCAKEPPG